MFKVGLPKTLNKVYTFREHLARTGEVVYVSEEYKSSFRFYEFGDKRFDFISH